MNGAAWLDELARRVVEQLADVEQFRSDPKTLSLARGTHGVTAHDDGDVMWLAPSFAAGGTIGSRLESRVQHLQIEQFGINEATIPIAVDSVVGHLRM
jgi:hypothetical protein